MRRSAIAITCVLLLAALLSPGAALAKGGNGRYPAANPRTSGSERSAARKSKAGRPATAKKTQRSARRTQATSANAKAKASGTRVATGAAAPKKAIRPAPAAVAPDLSTSASAKTEPGAQRVSALEYGTPSADLLSPQPAHVADIETRGVLDTIRARALVSLASVRDAVVKISSFVASWFGV